MSEQEFPLTDYEFGWLVALLEGEGTFGYYSTQQVTVQMRDEDIILKLNALYAKIYGREFKIGSMAGRKNNHSEMYKITLCGDNARYLMKSVVRHMGYRRRQQIYRALNEWVCPKLDLKLLMGGKK